MTYNMKWWWAQTLCYMDGQQSPTFSNMVSIKVDRSISHSSVCQLAPKLGHIYHMHEWRIVWGRGGDGWWYITIRQEIFKKNLTFYELAKSIYIKYMCTYYSIGFAFGSTPTNSWTWKNYLENKYVYALWETIE